MEILRLNNSSSVSFSVTVPTAGDPYTAVYTDLDTGEQFTATATSTPTKTATFTLDNRYMKYIGTLEATVFNDSEEEVWNDGIDIVRPYCDLKKIERVLSIAPNLAQMHERAARKIIEAQLDIKFGLRRVEQQAYGMGLDYLPMRDRIQTVFRIDENGTTVFDTTDEALNSGYKISVDRTSIVSSYEENAVEYKIIWADRYRDITFPSGFDYVVDGEFGYRVVPEDIQEACEILIGDIHSGNMRYSMNNILEFDNREFKIKYSGANVGNTGNTIVDSILSNYRKQINLGVL